MNEYVTVRELMDAMKLELLAGAGGLDKKITSDMISRPGLEFAGFYDYFDNKRMLLVGSKDATFLHKQGPEAIKNNLDYIFSHDIPCVVFSRNVIINPIFFEMGNKYNVSVLRMDLPTTASSSKLYVYLQDKLAERVSVHGTLMDIGGMGTLIIGKSGIGKSETAHDLIKRGHQLVADDLVEIMEREPGNLIGTSPNVLKRYMEIRGIGIVDVISMFGAASFRDKKMIRLVVELEAWDQNKYYDRLGIDEQKAKYFNTEIPKVTIPVMQGRNVALLVESAAMNEKLKYLGTNAAKEFVEKINHNASGR
ncbi:Hpr(Ser) kinase/phosphatase [Anaeroplasma bactoclasticum]|jgi:HPr kinase/phosphorylase|uniref:HPr kinase/phosphorylase n=1 Tax=Anaeroplasma bactoclasticum TaxID=2088 RepID=A0A397RUP3_9MOLU|nr:HPr(Ser) kinase/phosphatase [Anaeroplasma bactoclasticum]RIA75855.1 Hpr(Ser) kinase/phosphatase [Anaeroplasma bactoclasticum]